MREDKPELEVEGEDVYRRKNVRITNLPLSNPPIPTVRLIAVLKSIAIAYNRCKHPVLIDKTTGTAGTADTRRTRRTTGLTTATHLLGILRSAVNCDRGAQP